MIDPKHEVSITGQAELVGISRAAVYYLPRLVSQADLALMRRIDELHLEYPFAGARTLRDLLGPKGFEAGRKHIGTLMARMGVEALVRRKSTSRRAPGHEIYPYLLRNVAIEESNHIWAFDITYTPMKRGFVYLVAVMDWGEPQDPLVQTLEHADGRLLRRGDRALWCTEDREHRPGQPVHLHGVHFGVQEPRDRD